MSVTLAVLPVALAWLGTAGAVPAANPSPVCEPIVAQLPPEPSTWAPPQVREMTRVQLKLRPFLGLVGNSWGGIGEARVEHYFGRPFVIGIEMAPVAIAADGEGPGAIAHTRLHGGYAGDYLAVGMGIGTRLQRFARSGLGLSLAPTLRLGSLDGLHLALEYSYVIAPNQYTGKRTVGFSNVLASLAVPLGKRLALELDSGLSLVDVWAFATIGLRHRLSGDGGPGSWYLGGAFGGAWVIDRAPCDFDAAVPCGRSGRSFGPTIGVSVEHRF